ARCSCCTRSSGTSMPRSRRSWGAAQRRSAKSPTAPASPSTPPARATTPPRPRHHPARSARRAATERFLAAAVGGDLTALLEVLAPDVTLWGDGGGRFGGAPRVVQGRDKVARPLIA